MVVMHMGDDDVSNVFGTQVKCFKRPDRASKQRSTPSVSGRLGEACINQNIATLSSDYPDKVVHGHRQVMGVMGFHEVFVA
ncbi:hypothetical protein D9M71_777220 [compost metagenome]